MVVKVDGTFDETSPILNTATGSKTEVDEIELKTREAYKNLISSMKAAPLEIDNPEVALELFNTAVKIQNVPLSKQCVELVNSRLNKTNVLKILNRMSNPDPLDMEPSAPPIFESKDQMPEDWAQDLINNLRNNCLLKIDRNADFVLKQKEIEDLSYNDVLGITSRDTLGVSNEILVYVAVIRWAAEECKRRTLPVQKINLNAVLRDLVYTPRYGLMTKKDFLCRTIDGVKGPDRSGILSEAETEGVLDYIKKKNKHCKDLPNKWSVPRKISKEKPLVFQGESNESIMCKTPTCEKFALNFLTCWTVLFD